MRSFSVLVLVSCFVLSFASSHNIRYRKRYPGVSFSKRAEVGLVERDSNARFTYYQAGLGACGKQNSASDFIVALNAPEWSGGSHCFDMITITANGKTTQAQIVDECMGCPSGALDFSQSLFEFFADVSAGEVYGSWSYGSGNPSPTTSSWTPPTSTWSSPSPTPTPTTSSSTLSSTSSSTTSTKVSPSSSSSSSTWSSSSSAPPASSSTTGTSNNTPTGFIAQIYVAFSNIGAEIVIGVGGQ